MKYKILKRIALVVSVVLISVLVLPIIPIEARPPAMTQDYIIQDEYSGWIGPHTTDYITLGGGSNAYGCAVWRSSDTSKSLIFQKIRDSNGIYYLYIKNPTDDQLWYDVIVQFYFKSSGPFVPQSIHN